MTRRKKQPQEIEAFAGVMPGGQIAWATVRPTRADCLAMCERFQPSLEGHPSYLRIMPLVVGYDLNRQLAFQLGPEQPKSLDPVADFAERLAAFDPDWQRAKGS